MSNDELKDTTLKVEHKTQPAIQTSPNPLVAAQTQDGSPLEKAGNSEDKMAAIQLWTTVSTQLITATLAMIAVQGAFITFLFDKRQPSTLFYVFSALTLLLFIFSIGMAIKGIGGLAQSGYSGEWKKDDAVSKFFLQTVLCLLGLFFFFASPFFSGPSKESESDKRVNEFEQQLETLRQVESSNQQALELLRRDYSNLEKQLKQQAGGKTQPVPSRPIRNK